MDFHFGVWGPVPKQPCSAELQSLCQEGKEKFHSQILGKKNPVCCLFIYLESTYSNAQGGDRDADQVSREIQPRGRKSQTLPAGSVVHQSRRAFHL